RGGLELADWTHILAAENGLWFSQLPGEGTARRGLGRRGRELCAGTSKAGALPLFQRGRRVEDARQQVVQSEAEPPEPTGLSRFDGDVEIVNPTRQALD